MGDISRSHRGFDKAVPNDTLCPPKRRKGLHPSLDSGARPCAPGLQGQQHKHGGIWVLPPVTPRPQ